MPAFVFSLWLPGSHNVPNRGCDQIAGVEIIKLLEAVGAGECDSPSRDLDLSDTGISSPTLEMETVLTTPYSGLLGGLGLLGSIVRRVYSQDARHPTSPCIHPAIPAYRPGVLFPL